MLVTLTTGLTLWIGYGVLRGDWVIIAANVVGAVLSAGVLAFKIRDMRSRDCGTTAG
jgi:MtN3 and saliva related transmembrane protein